MIKSYILSKLVRENFKRKKSGSMNIAKCPECDHFLVVVEGENGMFIGCSNYPDCHFSKSIESSSSFSRESYRSPITYEIPYTQEGRMKEMAEKRAQEILREEESRRVAHNMMERAMGSDYDEEHRGGTF